MLLVSVIVCVCGAKTNIQKAEQDRCLIQLCMGFNEIYTMIRGNILMMNLLPSMAHTFALLVQEGKQREFKPSNSMFIKRSSVIASSSGSGSSHSLGGRNFRINYSPSNTNLTTPRGRSFCDYCRRPCHIKDKCYKLHGYPPGPHPNLRNTYSTTQYQRPNNHDQQNHDPT